jgi:hypothetical protein
MAKPIIGMIPPHGWHYFEGDVKITGSDFDNLIENIRHYRAENHLPIGDVTGDASSYICGNWPHFCHGVDSVVVTSIDSPSATSELMADITTWAKNLLHTNTPHQLVTDELAQVRAKICLNCKLNVNWRSGCGSCIAAADRLCASVRQGRDAGQTQVLGGCHKMRHDNRTAVFLEKEVLSAASDLPELCWLNK